MLSSTDFPLCCPNLIPTPPTPWFQRLPFQEPSRRSAVYSSSQAAWTRGRLALLQPKEIQQTQPRKGTAWSGLQQDATRVLGVCHQHQATQGLWQEAVDAKSSHKMHARTQQDMDLIKLPDAPSLPSCSLFFALSTSSRQLPTEHELCQASWLKLPHTLFSHPLPPAHNSSFARPKGSTVRDASGLSWNQAEDPLLRLRSQPLPF